MTNVEKLIALIEELTFEGDDLELFLSSTTFSIEEINEVVKAFEDRDMFHFTPFLSNGELCVYKFDEDLEGNLYSWGFEFPIKIIETTLK